MFPLALSGANSDDDENRLDEVQCQMRGKWRDDIFARDTKISKGHACDKSHQHDVPEAARPVQNAEEENRKRDGNGLAEFSEQTSQAVAAINTFFDEGREEHVRDGEGNERRAEGGEHGACGDVIPNVLQADEDGGEDEKVKQGNDHARDGADENFTPELLTVLQFPADVFP